MNPSLGNRYSQHSFAQIPQVNMARSKFDRSFAIKDTMFFDYLNPIFADEVLPGDTINLNVKSFARLAPQVVPLMDNMYMDYFFFFVPNRLVWNNWERFNGAQDDPGDSTDYLIPNVATPAGPNYWPVGSLADKFGIPTGVNINDLYAKVSALPFRMYNLIWNEWFRDQNLQNSVTVNKGDGPDAASTYTLLKRAKKHDYFTSALPWPQKGADVSLAVTGTIPVEMETTYPSQGHVIRNANTGALIPNAAIATTDAVGILRWAGPVAAVLDLQQTYNAVSDGGTNSLTTTINAFREAMMLQSLLELDARGGTRYTEILKAHFNVISPDFRLQRPEFLSGGSVRIAQHVVPQTSETGTTPQGNLAAYSTAALMNENIGFTKSFVEHGWVIGLVQARADVTYQQGLNKKWTRQTRYDYFWPKLQELGEQAILKSEIMVTGTSTDLDVFGYQERYAEYRYHPSEIRGQFRSTYSASLDVWHLAEEFATQPSLNSTFIESSTPIQRSLVVTAGYPHLLYDAWFEYIHARPMMTYGVPATLGRF